MWIHHASSSWSWVSLGHQRSSPQQLFLNPSNTYCLLIFCAPHLPARGLGDPGRLDVITLDVLGQELGPAGPAQEVRQTFPEEVDGLEGTREEERSLRIPPSCAARRGKARGKRQGSSSVPRHPQGNGGKEPLSQCAWPQRAGCRTSHHL